MSPRAILLATHCALKFFTLLGATTAASVVPSGSEEALLLSPANSPGSKLSRYRAAGRLAAWTCEFYNVINFRLFVGDREYGG
jgi:hypothetical protein